MMKLALVFLFSIRLRGYCRLLSPHHFTFLLPAGEATLPLLELVLQTAGSPQCIDRLQMSITPVIIILSGPEVVSLERIHAYIEKKIFILLARSIPGQF